MALPKIDLPLFELELPSTGEKIKYRPFTVKEEKILLVAQQSEEPGQEILAAKQIINNCIYDKDAADMAMFDLEYVVLSLRAKSVDNKIEFTIKDPDTDEDVKMSLDINDVKLERIEGHTNQVKINDEFTLFLKYPTIDEFIQIVEFEADDPMANYFILVSCLEKVASAEEIYYFDDYSAAEVNSFMEDLSGEVVEQIAKFFQTMPRLRHIIKYKNKNGDDKTFVIEGMRSFFI